jgi:DNA-directed RNA polymerase subunit M/transcription elongation factor TFIIS
MKVTSLTQDANSPAQDDIVVKEIHLDVLEANSFIEALGNKEPKEPSKVGCVKEGDTHVLWEPLQEREQHGPRVLPTCRWRWRR